VLQVDSPQRLYREPTNLFVAAFIGTPAMNLVEAAVDGHEAVFGQFRVPFASSRRPPAGAGGRVVLGIRPESFGPTSPGAPTIEVIPAVVEELGSDLLVFFTVEAPKVAAEAAREAEEETLLARDQALFSARLDPRTEARIGEPLQLSVDPARFHFFDPASGESLLSATADPPAVLMADELTPAAT
jgi:multiple sugar transport system ATP-binding protein